MKKLLKATKAYKIWYDNIQQTFSIEMNTIFFLDKNLTDSVPEQNLRDFVMGQAPIRAYDILYTNALYDLIDCIKIFKEDVKKQSPLNQIYDDVENYVPIQPKEKLQEPPKLIIEETPSPIFTTLEDIEKEFINNDNS